MKDSSRVLSADEICTSFNNQLDALFDVINMRSSWVASSVVDSFEDKFGVPFADDGQKWSDRADSAYTDELTAFCDYLADVGSSHYDDIYIGAVRRLNSIENKTAVERGEWQDAYRNFRKESGLMMVIYFDKDEKNKFTSEFIGALEKTQPRLEKVKNAIRHEIDGIVEAGNSVQKIKLSFKEFGKLVPGARGDFTTLRPPTFDSMTFSVEDLSKCEGFPIPYAKVSVVKGNNISTQVLSGWKSAHKADNDTSMCVE